MVLIIPNQHVPLLIYIKDLKLLQFNNYFTEMLRVLHMTLTELNLSQDIIIHV